MKVLFMCTHNSCRSILSEALFNHLAPEGMEAVSSGSFPSGKVNERALKTLEAAGIPTAGLSSKASDVFESSPPDIVVTVCDRAAGEAARSSSVHRSKPTGAWPTLRRLPAVRRKSNKPSRPHLRRSMSACALSLRCPSRN